MTRSQNVEELREQLGHRPTSVEATAAPPAYVTLAALAKRLGVSRDGALSECSLADMAVTEIEGLLVVRVIDADRLDRRRQRAAADRLAVAHQLGRY